MQQAFKPVLAQTPAQNLKTETGHVVYLFSPEKLNLSHKQIGIQMIEARHFVMFTDQAFAALDTSEMIFASDLSTQRGVVNQVKTAFACALEVVIQHGARGAVILESLIDLPPAKVKALEDKLVRMGWFTEPVLPNLTSILDQVAASDRYEEQAITDLKQAIHQAISYRLARMDDTANEAQQARRPEGFGRGFLTRVEREYYKEIGLDIPEGMTFEEVTANPGALQQSASSITPEELDLKLAENQKAMVEVFAAAMNNLVDKILSVKGGLDNAKEEEEGKPKQTRRSPLSAG